MSEPKHVFTIKILTSFLSFMTTDRLSKNSIKIQNKLKFSEDKKKYMNHKMKGNLKQHSK